MQRDDLTLIKYQIACEVFSEYDDVDERYRRYDPGNLTLTIAHQILKESLAENELREQVKRALEVDHNPIIGVQHFSEASYECIRTFHNGLFIACVMMTHPINEGIIKFVAERNHVKRIGKIPDMLNELVSRNLVTDACAQASEAIWKSFRNAIHHMNPDIAKIEDWHQLAKQNLRHLATVEYCVFGYDIKQGILHLHYPQHWDSNKEGQVTAWIRGAIR